MLYLIRIHILWAIDDYNILGVSPVMLHRLSVILVSCCYSSDITGIPKVPVCYTFMCRKLKYLLVQQHLIYFYFFPCAIDVILKFNSLLSWDINFVILVLSCVIMWFRSLTLTLVEIYTFWSWCCLAWWYLSVNIVCCV